MLKAIGTLINRKVLFSLLGTGFITINFGSNWGEMFYTKHNLYRDGDNMMPVYYFDRTAFFTFCFACHIRATPHAGVNRFATYGYDNEKLKEKHFYPQSLACLSCHDGFIAPNISPTKFGTHHPFFIIYKEERFVLRPPATPIQGWIGAQTIADLIDRFNGSLQCVSCHDPHVKITSFLKRSNEGSMLCLSCHEK